MNIAVLFLLLIVGNDFVDGKEEFKCKARTGCHFSGCDPVSYPTVSVLERNEFPLTCEINAAKLGQGTTFSPGRYDILLSLIRNNSKEAGIIAQDLKELKSSHGKIAIISSELEEKSEEITKDIRELKSTASANRRKIHPLIRDNANNKKGLSDLSRNVTKTSADFEVLEKKISRSDKELDILRILQISDSTQIRKLVKGNDELKTELSILRLIQKSDSSQIIKLKRENTGLKTELGNLRRIQQSDSNQLSKLEEENTELKTDLSNLRRIRQSDSTQLNKLKGENTDLKTELSNLRRNQQFDSVQIKKLNDEITGLKRDIQSSRRSESQRFKEIEAELDKIKQASEKGRTQGGSSSGTVTQRRVHSISGSSTGRIPSGTPSSSGAWMGEGWIPEDAPSTREWTTRSTQSTSETRRNPFALPTTQWTTRSTQSTPGNLDIRRILFGHHFGLPTTRSCRAEWDCPDDYTCIGGTCV